MVETIQVRSDSGLSEVLQQISKSKINEEKFEEEKINCLVINLVINK